MFPKTTPEVTHTFIVRNPTGRTVHVKQLSRSCTCTDATLSAREIPAGGTIDLTLRVVARPEDRDTRVFSTLETDDPAFPNWTYALTFRSYPALRFAIPIVSLDPAPSDGQAGSIADAPRRADAALEFYRPVRSGARQPHPRFTLTTQPPVTAAADAEPTVTLLENGAVESLCYPVHIAVDGSLDRDQPSGTRAARIEATQDDKTTAGLGLVWTRRAPLLVAPSSVSFGFVTRPDETVIRKVVVRSADQQPFRILATETGSADLVAQCQPEPDAGEAMPHHTIALTFQRPATASPAIAQQLVVRTDQPG